jgi:hypothetical protein
MQVLHFRLGETEAQRGWVMVLAFGQVALGYCLISAPGHTGQRQVHTDLHCGQGNPEFC